MESNPPQPSKRRRGRSSKASEAASPPKTRAKRKTAAPKASNTPATPEQQNGTSLPVGNAWPAGIIPPSSTVPSIFAESPNQSRTQIQEQPLATASDAASRKRSADQALDSSGAKLPKIAPEPTTPQESQNGLRVVDALALQTPSESESPETELRIVGGLAMPSLPEPSTGNGDRNGGQSIFTVPRSPGSQVSNHAPENGDRTGGGFISSTPQVPIPGPKNGSLRTMGGLTIPSLPDPSPAQPPNRPELAPQTPNDGLSPPTISVTTPKVSPPSQFSKAVCVNRGPVQNMRANSEQNPSNETNLLQQLPFQRSSSGNQQCKHSPTGMLCPGCDMSKDDCHPFWLCVDCKPDGTPKSPRAAEYQALSQQFSSYQTTAKATNNKILRENSMCRRENKALTERNQDLETLNIRYMVQAEAREKENKELQQRFQVGKQVVLKKENQELLERVKQQQQLITMLRRKTGDNYFTTTGEEQNSPALNRALSPSQNQIAVANGKAASPLRSPAEVVAVGHGQASSQGATNFPSDKGKVPQSNVYSLMDKGRSLYQSINGPSIQGMSPVQSPKAVATSQTASSRPTQVAIDHGRVYSQDVIDSTSSSHSASSQPSPNSASQYFTPKMSPSPSLSPNGFVVHYTQSHGMGFKATAGGQGSGSNGFAVNQNSSLGQEGSAIGTNNGASVVGQGQHPIVSEGYHGGNSERGESYYLQVGDGGGYQYPSPGC